MGYGHACGCGLVRWNRGWCCFDSNQAWNNLVYGRVVSHCGCRAGGWICRCGYPSNLCRLCCCFGRRRLCGSGHQLFYRHRGDCTHHGGHGCCHVVCPQYLYPAHLCGHHDRVYLWEQHLSGLDCFGAHACDLYRAHDYLCEPRGGVRFGDRRSKQNVLCDSTVRHSDWTVCYYHVFRVPGCCSDCGQFCLLYEARGYLQCHAHDVCPHGCVPLSQSHYCRCCYCFPPFHSAPPEDPLSFDVWRPSSALSFRVLRPSWRSFCLPFLSTPTQSSA
mmetsp:Transcript_56495/g.99257  ORF Transcript_56495/g.99257 Transcript_56495/m.99257 type:complete len:274 (+) Transcript_56495:1043-1864(+)